MRPVIGVTGPDHRFAPAWWATRLAVSLTGGRALRLTPLSYQQHSHDKLQGLIIGGGDDIDPSLYGGQDDGKAPIDPDRDRFEIEMIEHALQTQLPLMGICRGAQLINVVLGGSLFGDIRGMRSRTSNFRTPLPRKTALGIECRRLSQILGSRRWRINSLHHQAIDRLGDGIVVAARDLDGFVQAVECEQGREIIGVQWHPEYLPYLSTQRRLFRHLVDCARRSKPESLDE
ncbi:gamma-glutamyl-gamma-aminobutyrate hydrolase [Marinobacterium nitratireducens]|uniref:Gamma-glutamyl-gamma-aminobutyrate hydrolase n=1 Tax=Marinobacterium nitratireducens TaxID=518897 RepID=A0A918DRC1_9GAMM|nr:type 1 glutamine amidotransferase [Marinobacterium nitratireducens]GGO78692.1 gamma-glutamyl-gamma-aminobutyrate hydrolase [Marinobacterium nitratireducens]